MKRECSKYTSEDISCFIDNEYCSNSSGSGQEIAMAEHIQQCRYCSEESRRYRTLSDRFKNHVNDTIFQVDSAVIKHKLIKVMQDHEKKSWKNIFQVSRKYIFLKLTTIVLILFACIFTYQKIHFLPNGPSAIVKYLDTDYSSVMIIETQKEKHTIIWLGET